MRVSLRNGNSAKEIGNEHAPNSGQVIQAKMDAHTVKHESTQETELIESEEERKEREHFARIINAFIYYRPFSLKRVDDAEKHYDNLPDDHKKLIPNFLDHLAAVRECIEQNYSIIRLIIQDAEHIFENKQNTAKNETKSMLPLVSDMEKVKTTLKQFVRDWSPSGEQERKQCYEPVIQEIEKRFPKHSVNPSDVSILIPGAGLGRLAFELARRGYSCQGNEWSLFMLFSSNFVLNKCKETNRYKLHPWVHQWTNNTRNTDQLEAISFPDTDITDIPEGANFSMAAGDFLEVYREPGSWECVATVFFIDTAHNVIEYIQTIYKILKPGGVWINLGPLLYHYADMPNEMSIELSYTDVKSVIEQTGFIFEKEETKVKCNYTQNPESMLRYIYDSVFFVVRKPSCDANTER